MTHRRTWQKFEQRVASWFGTTRKALSGSGNQPGETTSDTNHPRLYIECKYRAAHAAVHTWDDAKPKADAEGKVLVVALGVKGRSGGWLLVHVDDFLTVAEEFGETAKEA